MKKISFNLNLKVSIGLFIIYSMTFLIDRFTLQKITISSVLLCIGALLVYIGFLSRIDTRYYMGIAIFTFFAQYLGGMLRLYDVIPIYDLLLHFASGTLLVLLADYVFVLITKKHSECVVPLNVRVIFCFFGSVASAAAWEIWEYSGDILLSLQSQGGLDDTMTDIVAGTIGALIGVFVLRAILLKDGKKGKPKQA